MPAAVGWIAANVATWVSGAVYNGLTAIGVSTATASLASTYAASLAIGTIYATAYLAPGLLVPRPDQPGLESAKEPANQTRAPRRWPLGGSQRLAGTRLLFASIRDYGFDVLYHCEGPAAAFGQTWLHDDPVTPHATTGVVAALSDGSYGDGKVSVHGKLGKPGQTAISELTALAGDLWTSAHKATGCVISALILRKTSDDKIQTVYRLGRPRLSRLVTFAFYDFRKDSTVPGGSGAHRRDDPSTWEASANPVVCLIHTELHRFGADWTRRFLPTLAVNRAAADWCDDLVAKAGGGTGPRYEVHATCVSSDVRATVRRWYLECMDGSLYRRPDGSIEVRAGKYEAASWILPAKHVVSLRKSSGRSSPSRINVLTGSFTSPDHGWTEQQATALRDEDDIALRGEQSDEFRLTLVASHDQWRRLAWRRWLRSRTGATFTVVTTLWGLTWPGHRWITLGAVPNGPPSLATAQEVEVLAVRKLFPLRVEFTLAPSTGSAIDTPDLAAGPGTVARPPRLATPVPALSSLTAVQIGDVRVLNAVVDPDYELGLGGNRFALRWRLKDVELGPEEGWTPGASVLAPDGATSLTLQTSALTVSGIYEVAVMAFAGGTASNWSAPYEVDGVAAMASLTFPGGPFRVGVAAANQVDGLEGWVYSRAGVGTARSADGTVMAFAADVPRITDQGLLIEPAAANLLLRSQEFDNASWAKTGAGAGLAPVVTANAATAPDGTTTADRVVFDLGGSNTLSDFSTLDQAVTVAAATVYRGSIWLRASSAVTVLCRHVGDAGYALFNVTTAWQRFAVGETSAGTAVGFTVGLRGGLGASGAATVEVWGAQLELGSTATSYIPTTAATVTRPADTATLVLPSGSSSDPIEVGHSGGTVSTTRGALADPLLLDIGGASGGGWVGNYIETVTVKPV